MSKELFKIFIYYAVILSIFYFNAAKDNILQMFVSCLLRVTAALDEKDKPMSSMCTCFVFCLAFMLLF